MSQKEQKHLSKADLMKQILGIRRNPQKKVLVKTLQKPIQKQQPSLNKTTILPSSILPIQPQSQQSLSHQQQLKSILSMSVSRKKQNYLQLKRWDSQRSQQLQLHINAIEQLHNKVDQLIKASIDHLEVYITFFKERAKCEEKLAASPIIDVRKSIEHNGLAKTAYTNCTLLLNLVYDNSIEEGQRCQLLANTIRKVILKERLDEHSSQSHLNLLRIRERISSLRGELTQCNQETQKRSTLLIESYTLNENNTTSNSDFYLLQLSFVEQAAEQTQIQKRLGELCLDYLKLAINEEQKRRTVLKQCMGIYMDALKYTYHLEKHQNISQKDTPISLPIQGITQLYSLQKLLDSRILNLISLKFSTPTLTLPLFQRYLMNFQFNQFTSKLLLLKEYNIYHQPSKNKFQPCYVIITADLFLHLFFSPSGVYTKPSVSLKVDGMLVAKSVGENKVEVKRKEERKRSMMSYIWDNKAESVYCLQFAKKDVKEEFLVFLKKLI